MCCVVPRKPQKQNLSPFTHSLMSWFVQQCVCVCVCFAFVLWGWLWSGLAVKYSHCFGMGMRVCIWMIVARFGVSVS